MNMKYTDNIKGFRRRKVLVKLEHLLDEILLYIDDLEDLLLYTLFFIVIGWDTLVILCL